jgi:hypothetical protein
LEKLSLALKEFMERIYEKRFSEAAWPREKIGARFAREMVNIFGFIDIQKIVFSDLGEPLATRREVQRERAIVVRWKSHTREISPSDLNFSAIFAERPRAFSRAGVPKN